MIRLNLKSLDVTYDMPYVCYGGNYGHAECQRRTG